MDVDEMTKLFATVVLRASGESFNVDDVLRQLGLSSDAVWRAGEKDRGGSIRSRSGCNLHVIDASTRDELELGLEKFAESSGHVFQSLSEAGASLELDVGLMVGQGAANFTASVRFPPRLLVQFAECGVTVGVSAYPCSDED